jgi:UMF1 family MFS transporter
MNQPKNDPKILNAWASYDWANSVYNLTINVAIFPIYYDQVTRAAFGSEVVPFLGFKIVSSVLLAYALSFSFLLAAVLSPLLAGVADYGGNKRQMMKFFTYLGATSSFALFFFTGANIEYGILFSILASFGFTGAVVFYVAYLPEIATEDRYDEVSARGFSLGFLGSAIQLVLCLILVLMPATFGITEPTLAPRISFVLVAVWWVGFAQIAFFRLPKGTPKPIAKGESLFRKGFQALGKVWNNLKNLPNLKRFLWAFFFYSMGAQTVILLASLFGSKELQMDSSKLIGTILFLQIVGISGAYLFAYISKKRGNKFSLLSIQMLWILLCIGGFFVYQESQFYMLAFGVGVAMGGVHLSRSTYAKLIPQDTPDTASYFSFFDVTEKLSIVIGTFSYGLIESLTGNMRNSILALGVFFLLGILLLMTVKVPRQE